MDPASAGVQFRLNCIAKIRLISQIDWMYRVASHSYLRVDRLVMALAALTCSAVAGGVSQTRAACDATTLPTKVSELTGADIYKSPRIQGGERLTVFSFPRRLDPLRRRKIVDEDPLYAIALLSDGSRLSFDRNCRGARCVYSGIKIASKASDCWAGLADENATRDRTASNRFILGGDKFISFRNSRAGGSLILHKESGNWETWEEEVLLVGPRPIVGFGVSIVSIHGGIRNIDVIRRERNGSLSLSTYVFMPTASTDTPF